MKIQNWEKFIKESKDITDDSVNEGNRTKKLSEEEFLEIFKNKCKYFSFNNDLLWRSKDKKFDLELFEPNYRSAHTLAFTDFFNQIENNPDYPVVRKKSLIGGTNPEINKYIVGSDNYLVIPFDNTEIVFCCIFDLWGISYNRKDLGDLRVKNGEPIGPQHFVKVKYTQDFRIPREQLDKIRNNVGVDYRGKDNGYEFFTSSPCLMIHKDKLNWFKDQLANLK